MQDRKKVNYWTWSDSELVGALEHYKEDVPEPFERKIAIEKIKAAEQKIIEGNIENTKTYIELLREEHPELRLVTVVFHSSGENDAPYVFVGHNGACFYLPKEQEIDVPDFILKSCIKDAVEERMFPKVGIDGKIIWEVRKVQRFPYSIVNM